MSRAERDKWDARYRAGAYSERAHPTALLADWLGRLPRGRALDVACGAGRNALYLAAAGYAVDAVDISSEGLERGRATATERGVDVSWHCVDLEESPDALPRGQYDLVVWVRYVNAALWPAVLARLAPGGHLLVEQHLVTNAEVVGPTSAAFRLAHGELARAAKELVSVYDHEGLIVDPDGRAAALAQLIARRPE
ncbi:MAG TPA: methyltransferase domain-containing protein [Gammaproteobacteria bacterium]|nr:methyltransferase domain-containing protein [Gammaproteobacteria bacterium]